jgi:hypothetical protein
VPEYTASLLASSRRLGDTARGCRAESRVMVFAGLFARGFHQGFSPGVFAEFTRALGRSRSRKLRGYPPTPFCVSVHSTGLPPDGFIDATSRGISSAEASGAHQPQLASTDYARHLRSLDSPWTLLTGESSSPVSGVRWIPHSRNPGPICGTPPESENRTC